MYPEDKSKLEMCFDCTNYQGQFPEHWPFEGHVFQTIFLNKERDSKLWPIDEIDESKIIRKDWWHQLCHSYTRKSPDGTSYPCHIVPNTVSVSSSFASGLGVDPTQLKCGHESAFGDVFASSI